MTFEHNEQSDYYRGFYKKNGPLKLGPITSFEWDVDPKHLVFKLSRYKFVAKMLNGYSNALEVGSGDGVGATIVKQHVDQLSGIDIDDLFLEESTKLNNPKWKINFFNHNIIENPTSEKYDAIYSLDVIEHIEKSIEDKFIENINRSLTDTGVLIIGSPSLNSQTYASDQSKVGHINCKQAPELESLMKKYFNTVFIFSMNDEVVHTGFSPMSHYFFAVCSHKKSL
jgi:2-polyprenyl-3-methyl-5-hydroxy-6-metoxy-1,4-benzoquinol methylase